MKLHPLFTLLFIGSLTSHMQTMPSLVRLARLGTSKAAKIAAAPRISYTRCTIKPSLSITQKRPFISKATALTYTVMGGTITGGAAYAATRSKLFAVGVGSIGALLVGIVANGDTEEASVRSMTNKLLETKISLEIIYCLEKDPQVIVDKMQQHYIASPTPLASAFNDLRADYKHIQEAKGLASTLHNETKKEEYLNVCKECDEKLANISRSMEVLKKQPQFSEQINTLYNRQTAENAVRSADAAERNATANAINAWANFANSK